MNIIYIFMVWDDDLIIWPPPDPKSNLDGPILSLRSTTESREGVWWPGAAWTNNMGPASCALSKRQRGRRGQKQSDALVLRPWGRRNSDVWKSLSVWGWCSHNRWFIRFPERENTPSLLWSLVAACFTPLHLMLCIGLGDVRLGWSTSLSEGHMKFGGLYWKLATKYFSICVLRCPPLGGWGAVLPHRSHFVVHLHSQLTVESLVTRECQNSPYCRRCIPSPENELLRATRSSTNVCRSRLHRKWHLNSLIWTGEWILLALSLSSHRSHI